MKVRQPGSTPIGAFQTLEGKSQAHRQGAAHRKGGQDALKGLEHELAALIQKLQAFEKRFFGDSFDPGSSPAGGSPPVGASGGNTGAAGPAGDAGDASAAPGAVDGGEGGADSADPVDGSTDVSGAGTVTPGAGSSGIATDDPRLAQALDRIYTDPDGRKLIDAAKAAGLTQVISNPGLNPDGGAGTQGETFSGPDGQRIEIADPGSANLIQTLAHELGHAATPQDGDSQTEEATVDALGNQIQQRLLGRAADFQLDAGAYSNLAADNGIKLDLRQLGIIVP